MADSWTIHVGVQTTVIPTCEDELQVQQHRRQQAIAPGSVEDEFAHSHSHEGLIELDGNNTISLWHELAEAKKAAAAAKKEASEAKKQIEERDRKMAERDREMAERDKELAMLRAQLEQPERLGQHK